MSTQEREIRNATMGRKARLFVGGEEVTDDDEEEDGENEDADQDYTSDIHDIHPASHFQQVCN